MFSFTVHNNIGRITQITNLLKLFLSMVVNDVDMSTDESAEAMVTDGGIVSTTDGNATRVRGGHSVAVSTQAPK